jgi:hypothetical protein
MMYNQSLTHASIHLSLVIGAPQVSWFLPLSPIVPAWPCNAQPQIQYLLYYNFSSGIVDCNNQLRTTLLLSLPLCMCVQCIEKYIGILFYVM